MNDFDKKIQEFCSYIDNTMNRLLFKALAKHLGDDFKICNLTDRLSRKTVSRHKDIWCLDGVDIISFEMVFDNDKQLVRLDHEIL
jgi:hypothetical protein